MKRGTRLLVGLLGLITALQLFHSYVTFTRHAAETADAHPAELRPKPPGWRERLPSENAPPLEREEQPVRDARGTKPHIVYLLADDLGWHGVGWRNPEVQTPNLDRLATREGLRLSQHCSQDVLAEPLGLAQWATRASRQSSESESPPPGRHDRRRPAIHAIDARRLQE